MASASCLNVLVLCSVLINNICARTNALCDTPGIAWMELPTHFLHPRVSGVLRLGLPEGFGRTFEEFPSPLTQCSAVAWVSSLSLSLSIRACSEVSIDSILHPLLRSAHSIIFASIRRCFWGKKNNARSSFLSEGVLIPHPPAPRLPVRNWIS